MLISYVQVEEHLRILMSTIKIPHRIKNYGQIRVIDCLIELLNNEQSSSIM